MGEVKVISEGQRYREIIRDDVTVHQEKNQDGNWVARFTMKEYTRIAKEREDDEKKEVQRQEHKENNA
jgi:hypothetical protein